MEMSQKDALIENFFLGHLFPKWPRQYGNKIEKKKVSFLFGMGRFVYYRRLLLSKKKAAGKRGKRGKRHENAKYFFD